MYDSEIKWPEQFYFDRQSTPNLVAELLNHIKTNARKHWIIGSEKKPGVSPLSRFPIRIGYLSRFYQAKGIVLDEEKLRNDRDMKEGMCVTGVNGFPVATIIFSKERTYADLNVETYLESTIDLGFVFKLAQSYRKQSNKGFLEQLVDLDFPVDEAAESLKELDGFIMAKRILIPSKHKPVFIQHSDGGVWILKPSSDKESATFEAQANYHLHANGFEFIPGSMLRMPLEGDGIYLNILKARHVNPGLRTGLEYWLKVLAQYHTAAKKTLEDAGVNIPRFQIRTLDKFKFCLEAARELDLLSHPDIARLSDDIQFLGDQAEGQDYLLHGDIKSFNLLGEYMLDLEKSGLSKAPGLDLAMLLMERHVPRARWEEMAKRYLAFREPYGYSSPQLRDITASFNHAANYAATKELVGASLLMRINDEQRKQHRYLAESCRQSGF